MESINRERMPMKPKLNEYDIGYVEEALYEWSNPEDYTKEQLVVIIEAFERALERLKLADPSKRKEKE